VGRRRARSLWAKGFRKPADLRDVTPGQLAAIPGIGSVLAESIIEQATGGRGRKAARTTTWEEENGARMEEEGAKEGSPDGGSEKDDPGLQTSLASFSREEGGEGDG
jgi:hypothetical protein